MSSTQAAPDAPHDAPLPPHPHLWPASATLDARGSLWLAGLEAAALARAYGTPLYVFDEATIRAACRGFRQALAAAWEGRESAVAYAGKAYLSPALCALLRAEDMELDVVSAGELGMALASGFPAERIHLHGNYKPTGELGAALAAGIGRIVVDSLDELAQVEALARARGRPAAIWLRLCPDVPADTHPHIQTGHAASKFGLDTASGAAQEAARRATASPWLDLAGLHAHAGSQLMEVATCARVAGFLADFAADLREQNGAAMRELSPGGGLGVAYLPEERAPAVAQYAESVAAALAAVLARRRMPAPRLIVEPGRALIARAGVALYTVGPRKTAPGGTVLLAVDGGLGDNPRPALYGARYHAALCARMTAAAEETVRVVGRYCESGDVLAEAVALPRAHPGEVLAVPMSGAYHLPMASNYNLVPRPAVAFVREGKARLVRRRETLDDLLRLECAVE
jgi:diaminopimelate decarboxylase